MSEPTVFSPLTIALRSMINDLRGDKTRARTSCEVPTGLAFVVRGQFLMFTMPELAVVAGEAAPGGVVIPTDPPRF